MIKAPAADPGPIGLVHDFVVTGRSLVIVIPPFVYKPGAGDGALLDDLQWRPPLGTRVLVVDKGSSPVGGEILRWICPMPFDDVGDGVLADAEVAGDPTVAPPAVDGMEHLRCKPV